MKVLPWPSVTTRRCNECGQWKPRWEFESDAWCNTCRGENPERVVVLRPAELEPVDWMVVAAPFPGCHPGPYTFARAVETAKEFGGLVRPWAAGPPKALGVFPNYGQMHRGER